MKFLRISIQSVSYTHLDVYKRQECTQEAPNPFATGDIRCDTEETGIRCACAGNRNPPPSPRPQTPVPSTPQTKSVCVSPNKCVDVATAVKMGCIDATATSTVGKMLSLIHI